MITKAQIATLFNDWHTDETIFLVEITVSKGSKIEVLIDKIGGLNVSSCVSLSRHIEASLDREKDDFELLVSSPGADAAFTVPQQYIKNEGRNIKVTTNDNEVLEGELKSSNEEGFTMQLKTKKKAEVNTVFLPYIKIKETKVIISFK